MPRSSLPLDLAPLVAHTPESTMTRQPLWRRLLRGAGFVLAVSTVAVTGSAGAAATRVNGEPAKALSYKAAALDASFSGTFDASTPTISFFAMDPARVETVKRGNSTKFGKATQIGIMQSAADEAFDAPDMALRWKPVLGGGMAAQFKARSPGALATRVLVKVNGLSAGSELRFAGSDDVSSVIHAAGVNEITASLDEQGRYWTPLTEGDTQLVEIYVPSTIVAAASSVSVNAISHIFASFRDGFKSAIQPKGLSGACEVDVICAAQTAAFVNAKNAVAHMTFQAAPDGTLGSYVCTGTLLNDTDPATQIPYFYGANHCISKQSEASTLITYWNYENPVCRGTDIARSQSTAVQGGADLLYADQPTDVLLLKLRSAPPAFAFFSGWDTATISGSAPITVIHHPAGDPKKVTLGQTLANPFSAVSNLGGSGLITATYTSGVTEGGSSGSGLLSLTNGSYFLRGGLYGGPSSCATAGNVNDPNNLDYYSRFDLAYPALKQWLDPVTSVLPPLSKRGGIDLDGNNKSVMLVTSTVGLTQAGRLVNNTFVWSSSTILNPGQNFRMLGAVDFAGTGKSDLAALQTATLNASGQGDARLYRNFDIASGGSSLRLVKPEWDVQVVGDLDGDGFGDLVWRFRGQSPNIDDQGVSYIWFTDGNGVTQVRKRGGAPLTWKLLGAADLNGDNAADMIYVSPDNVVRVLMATPNRTCANLSGGTIAAGSTAVKIADFTGNRRGDILSRNSTTGAIQITSLSAAGITLPTYTGAPDDPNASCTSSNLSVTQTATYTFASNPTWIIFATGDFDGDGIFDIVFMQPDRTLTVWKMGANGALPTVFNAGTAPANFSPFPLQ